MIIEKDAIISHFNYYFSFAANRLIKNILKTSVNLSQYLPKPIHDFIFLSPTFPREIKEIICTFKPKISCAIDDILAKVIKHLPENIMKVLSFSFNLSCTQGQYIERSNIAKVAPILKKTRFQNHCKLLHCFSKILEKVTYSKLYNFLDKHKFLMLNDLDLERNV